MVFFIQQHVYKRSSDGCKYVFSATLKIEKKEVNMTVDVKL